MGSYGPDLVNEAAWSKEPKEDVEIGPADVYEPGPREILVKNESIAFAPVDFKNQKFLLHPMTYPGILGSSFAGIVEQVGQEVDSIRPGNKVACNRPSYGQGDYRYGAFQKYVLASVDESSKLERRTELQEAAATIVNLSVSVSALSSMGIEQPPIYGTGAPKNKKLLVYGGSSSTGGYAVRYASLAGYTIVTTSSPKNLDFVSTLGAKFVIDHTQPEDQIVADLKAKGPYDYIFDSIGLPPVTNVLCALLEEKGGAYTTLLPLLGGEKPVPANVTRVFDSWSSKLIEPDHHELGRWFYEEYVPQGLASGAIVPTRQIEVEGGLDSVQDTLNAMGPVGASGHKFMLKP